MNEQQIVDELVESLADMIRKGREKYSDDEYVYGCLEISREYLKSHPSIRVAIPFEPVTVENGKTYRMTIDTRVKEEHVIKPSGYLRRYRRNEIQRSYE